VVAWRAGGGAPMITRLALTESEIQALAAYLSSLK
jgi:hypothetical protein